MHRTASTLCHALIGTLLLFALPGFATTGALAQAAAASPATRVVGTVKSVSASALSVTRDDGTVVTLMLADSARIQQLPAGSTDLKAAQPATASDIAEGDRVLVAAHPGDAGVLSATRVVLMKSGDLAQTNATRQADWQKRGSGGIVTAVDLATKTVTIASGTRKTTVQTTDRTVFRRYAPGSVKFEDAKVGSLPDITVGDQLRVRGSRDVDTGSVAAEEVVSGAFRNLAGTVASVDVAAHTLTLKDLATKKNVVVTLGPGTDVRTLPPEMAARFASRSKSSAATGTEGAGAPASPNPGTGRSPSGIAAGSAAPDSSPRARSGAGAGGDLSQAVPRLPKITAADLKTGDALLVVGSGAALPGQPLTAITVLAGVEPLLAASPQGSSSFNLSPWSLGGGETAGTTP